MLLLLRERVRRVGDCCETRTALNVVVERFFFGIIIKIKKLVYYILLLLLFTYPVAFNVALYSRKRVRFQILVE